MINAISAADIAFIMSSCLVTKPLGVFSSETKWLNASLLFLRMNYMCKCIIKQLLDEVEHDIMNYQNLVSVLSAEAEGFSR